MEDKRRPTPFPARERTRHPPAWMSPAQKRAFYDARQLERFLKRLLADEPSASVINWLSCITYARQVYSCLHKVKDPALQDRRIRLRILDWTERGLDERVLRRVEREIRKAVQEGGLR